MQESKHECLPSIRSERIVKFHEECVIHNGHRLTDAALSISLAGVLAWGASSTRQEASRC